MGRSSSTGLPFLIRRPDAGKYTYQRDVPAVVAPFVTGEVMLSWSDRARRLRGKTTIKVSLGTGDERTARQRWAGVHAQVEALVQLADLQSRHPPQPGAAAATARLDPHIVRAMAGQAHHDMLATDDRTQVEPGFMTPIAGIVHRLTGLGNHNARAGDRQAAELVVRRVQQGIDTGRLRRRETWIADRPIVETDLDITVDGLTPGLQVGDRLAPEQIEALARGIRIDEISSEVEVRLKENGLELPAGHVDRRAIALAITRAKLQAFAEIAQRDKGAPIETPNRPTVVVAPAPPTAQSAPTLSTMRKRWIALVRPSRKQQDDNARYARLFVSLHGDLAVDQITGQHVRDFRDKLLLCPRNAPKSLARAPLSELMAWAKDHPDEPKLGRNTINAKALGAISTLLTCAHQDEVVRTNVTTGHKLPTRGSDTLQRQPYTIEELKVLFSTTVYAPHPVIPKAGGGWAAWWLPLLALFSGGRLEELGQALVADVRHLGGIYYLEITMFADDDDGEGGSRKSLKTEAAERRVPLHPMLIKLGFLDYVAFVRAAGATRLFPELREYRGRFTKDWSKWWGRWLDKHVTADTRTSFHSFRHTFIAELRRLKVPDGMIKELVGHAQTDVTSGYGRREGRLHELADLNKQIERLAFDGLDLAHLRGANPWRTGP